MEFSDVWHAKLVTFFHDKAYKGPFKYYVSKWGGWVVPNAYFCLQRGWVGYSKCLRKQNIKIFRKKMKAYPRSKSRI